MAEHDGLLEKLLTERPEMTREEVESRIKDKKDKIGAGYLTDSGALFLIAADLGVALTGQLKSEMSLKDLYAGARDVSVETRVMSVSPAKKYPRKDGSEFSLRTLTVYDGGSTASVKLWDEKANLPGMESLKPGDLIRIIKAYVKSERDGTPSLNIGSESNIEPSNEKSEIPTIDSITIDAGQIKENQKNMAVTGTIGGPIGSIHFTNSKGNPGKGLKFTITGQDRKPIRVVIWGKDESDMPAVVSASAKARLLGVNAKTGQQGTEIHGNESTIIEVDGSQEVKPITARILNIANGERGARILGVDEAGCMVHFMDEANVAGEFAEGDVIECMPSRAFGDAVTLGSDSFVRKMDDDGKIPQRDKLRTKIADIKPGKSCCIEAIILKIPERRDIQTKTGESVILAEMFVEDDTGQIWVKGWRDNAKFIEKYAIGEIISIAGIMAKPGFEGKTELIIGAFTSIKKKI